MEMAHLAHRINIAAKKIASPPRSHSTTQGTDDVHCAGQAFGAGCRLLTNKGNRTAGVDAVFAD
jgi:hypothetical protein